MNKPITTDSTIKISLACNMWNGAFLGFVTGLDFGEMELVNPNTDSAISLAFDHNQFEMDGEQFWMVSRQRNHPDLQSDEIVTTAGEFCRLLNWARADDLFRIKRAPIPIWQVWRSGQAFSPAHLQSCFD